MSITRFILPGFFFIFGFIGTIGTVVQLWDRRELRARTEGVAKPPKLRSPWLAMLLIGAILAFGVGFWLIWHPPVASSQMTTVLPTTRAPAPMPSQEPSPVPAVSDRSVRTTAKAKIRQQAVQSGVGNTQIQAGHDAITQTMTNSPGGMQAGRDLTVIGKVSPPDRAILPDDEKTAVDLLRTVPMNGKMTYFIKYPTASPENSEISRFQLKLENIFARGGWTPWQDRETHLGPILYMGENGNSNGGGIGCTVAAGHEHEAAVAMQVLAILKHPCTGPSVHDFEHSGPHGDFVIYISVGTRLAREE